MRIQNVSGKPLHTRFDGVNYIFEKDEVKNVSDDAHKFFQTKHGHKAIKAVEGLPETRQPSNTELLPEKKKKK